MSEKLPTSKEEVYDEQGRVKDPEIAREMAKVEDPYHKKILGVIPTTQKRIEKGEKDAEGLLDEILKMNRDEEWCKDELDKRLQMLEGYRDHFDRFPAYVQKNWQEVLQIVGRDDLETRWKLVFVNMLCRDVEKIWHDSAGFCGEKPIL